MTPQEIDALVRRLEGIADYAESKGSVTVARTSREAASALRSLLAEKDAARELLKWLGNSHNDIPDEVWDQYRAFKERT